MKWMCVILMLGSNERIEKYNLSHADCVAWKRQQHYSPQYPIKSGPLVMYCSQYWEA